MEGIRNERKVFLVRALFVIALGHGMLRLARLDAVTYACCPPSSRTFSAKAVAASATLAFLIASENDIGDDGSSGSGSGVVIVGLVNPVATSPASPRRGTRRSGDDGDSWCCPCLASRATTLGGKELNIYAFGCVDTSRTHYDLSEQ